MIAIYFCLLQRTRKTLYYCLRYIFISTKQMALKIVYKMVNIIFQLALSGALLAPQILPKESLESKTESIKLGIDPLLVSFN